MASPAIDLRFADARPSRRDPDRIVVSYGDADERWVKWFRAVIARIGALLQLEDDWDTYGGLPVSDGAVAATLDLLSYFGPEYKTPDISPNPDGGLLLQWSHPEVEIEAGPSGRVSLFIQPDKGNPVDMEGAPIERVLLEHYEDLVRALRRT